jgi:hypothetical protein
MSFSSVDNKRQYATDGIVDTFAFNLPFQQTSDLVVKLKDTTTLVETTLVENTDYTVTPVGDVGRYTSGSVVTNSTYASGSTITILRIVANDQETANYNAGGNFDEQSTEDAFDKASMQSQQNYNGSVILKQSGDVAGPLELPDLADNAGKLLQISSDGKSITASDSTTSSDARVNSLFNGAAADDIFTTFINLSTGTLILAGTGSPEGVHVAPVSSIFCRTDGGAGTSIYFKETGAGNTGWAARNAFGALTCTTLLATTYVITDIISEKTAAAGVTVDGFGIKDGGPNPTSWPSFAAYLSGQQNILATGTTKIAFNAEVFDSNSDYDHATNYRFTPTAAGKYLIHSYLDLANCDAGTFQCWIYKNGALYAKVADISGAAGRYIPNTAIIDMNGTTDYIEIFVNSTTDANFFVNGNSKESRFEASRIA